MIGVLTLGRKMTQSEEAAPPGYCEDGYEKPSIVYCGCEYESCWEEECFTNGTHIGMYVTWGGPC